MGWAVRNLEERFCSHSRDDIRKTWGLGISMWKSIHFSSHILVCGGSSSPVGRVVFSVVVLREGRAWCLLVLLQDQRAPSMLA